MMRSRIVTLVGGVCRRRDLTGSQRVMIMVGVDVLQALDESSHCRILGFVGTARQNSAAVFEVRGGSEMHNWSLEMFSR